MTDPFISHSEISNEIYIICGRKKYPVTEQVVSAMKATGRLNEIQQGYWKKDEWGNILCSNCGRDTKNPHYPFFCCFCGAEMRCEDNA